MKKRKKRKILRKRGPALQEPDQAVDASSPKKIQFVVGVDEVVDSLRESPETKIDSQMLKGEIND